MPKRKSTLTADELRSALHYDPATGIFTWLNRADIGPNVNAKWVGKRAGWIKRGRYPYRCIGINDRKYRANRLAWLYMTGEWPPHEVDHWNADTLDDSWVNLRSATRSQNAANGRRHRDRVHDLPKGVMLNHQRFMAMIRCEGMTYYLGTFDTPEEAADAYSAKARELFGEFARTE